LPYQRAGELRRRGLPDRQDLSSHLQHVRPTAGARHTAPAERSGVLQEVAPPAHLGLQLTRDSACIAARARVPEPSLIRPSEWLADRRPRSGETSTNRTLSRGLCVRWRALAGAWGRSGGWTIV